MGKRIAKIKSSADVKKSDVLFRIRSQQYPRWIEVCGVDDYTEIDYDNPFVKIEWLLSDPAWLHAIKSEKGREEFKKRLDDPLAWYIFTSYRDEETGQGYWDLTSGVLRHQMRTKYTQMRRKKNAVIKNEYS